MPAIRKRQFTEQNVYDAALDRIRHLYDIYDEIVVSFSGGKDSTATLLCTIDVAEERGKLPVKAIFYDEEASHPPTIEYVERIRQDPRVDLEWYCLPIMHRNACSNEQPFWHPWHPDEEAIWTRPLPENVIRDHPRFEWGMPMQDFGIAHFEGTGACVLQGIRTQESLRRYRVVAIKKEENYIAEGAGYTYAFAYPIYDWTSEDVWRLVQKKNADYNRTYDILNRTNKFEDFLHQRVCPPFGEEPLRGLHEYAECFPEMWEKMIHRVPGAATAARYGNTELYLNKDRPKGTNWRQHVQNVLETYTGVNRGKVQENINTVIKRHKRLTDNAIPQDEAHPVSGVSWKFLAQMAVRGDFKGRVLQNMAKNAQKTQIKLGLTLAEATEKYGKKK